MFWHAYLFAETQTTPNIPNDATNQRKQTWKQLNFISLICIDIHLVMFKTDDLFSLSHWMRRDAWQNDNGYYPQCIHPSHGFECYDGMQHGVVWI